MRVLAVQITCLSELFAFSRWFLQLDRSFLVRRSGKFLAHAKMAVFVLRDTDPRDVTRCEASAKSVIFAFLFTFTRRAASARRSAKLFFSNAQERRKHASSERKVQHASTNFCGFNVRSTNIAIRWFCFCFLAWDWFLGAESVRLDHFFLDVCLVFGCAC